MMRELADIADVRGKRVLVRAGLNVPVKDGAVQNDFRIRRALPTLQYLRERRARIIVIAHIGRERDETLEPVAGALSQKLERVRFVDDLVGAPAADAVWRMADGDIIVLQNLRSHEGETKNDSGFAKQIAALGECYVNDAFSASHREHASIVGIPRHLPGCAGLLFEEEVAKLRGALKPESPSLFIVGGAKFQTKAPLIEKFLERYDRVFVGGALAHDFFKARGFAVGHSLVSDDIEHARALLDHPKLLLPVDVMVRSPEGVSQKRPEEVGDNDTILDAGAETVRMLEAEIDRAAYALWNGPLGNYEKGFKEHTEAVAQALAKSGAYSIVGGGDTVSSIAELSLEGKFSFVSTGGGAMLDFLLDGDLPGISALEENAERA